MSRGVLVTGASRGIGRAIALAFAGQGDRVAVHYGARRADAETTLAALSGGGHTLLTGDLADPAQAERIAAAADESLAGVEVLVNNAALAPAGGNAHPITETAYVDWQARWREMFELNVLGGANLIHRVAYRMVARGHGGTIVNIGSRGAFRGEPDHPAYGASKAALHSLTQSLAVSLAPHGIAVAAVAPGVTATERLAPLLDRADADDVRAESPFGRVGRPEEVAAAVRYLASPEAVWASGAILDLNGASYLRT